MPDGAALIRPTVTCVRRPDKAFTPPSGITFIGNQKPPFQAASSSSANRISASATIASSSVSISS
ncbi:hypothetical protein EVY06_00070 [Citrobacter koseri]|uniref:Uncharacterized protein n=1 Tax=Citrobacter koseri TaxID=545 RepID=A0AAQ0V5S8_CITKO|nr:hypothetical protein AM351_22295 [Citrobacter koseri]AVK73937.1 hypothetical protein CEP66_24505 [Citrobacter koseri]PNN13047.1 hypothetical protein AL526_010180 [Citrobacter koseri]RSC16549.1 hypothetical protein EGS84_06140 [Citrobacter koseri]RZB04286.1 hypothetical protein EVY06_00070 [Citrobacter koseri]